MVTHEDAVCQQMTPASPAHLKAALVQELILEKRITLRDLSDALELSMAQFITAKDRFLLRRSFQTRAKMGQ